MHFLPKKRCYCPKKKHFFASSLPKSQSYVNRNKSFHRDKIHSVCWCLKFRPSHHISSNICNHICHKKTFGNFPKIHPIWYFYPSLSDNFKSRDPSASKNDIGFDWLEPLSTDLFIVLFSRLVGGREGLEIETEIHRFQVQRINL